MNKNFDEWEEADFKEWASDLYRAWLSDVIEKQDITEGENE